MASLFRNDASKLNKLGVVGGISAWLTWLIQVYAWLVQHGMTPWF